MTDSQLLDRSDSVSRERSTGARRPRKGDRVSGRVTKIGDSMAFVDLGGTLEGLLDLMEFRDETGAVTLSEGEPVEAVVRDVAANGVLLRRVAHLSAEALQQLRAAHQIGIPVPARIVSANKGGLELDLFGIRAFCPAAQFDVKRVDDLGVLVGQEHDFRIIEVSSGGSRIILSRRAILQEAHDRDAALKRESLTPGTIVEGKVSRVVPFGVFVDLGFCEGLVHVTELSRSRVADPSAVVKVGDSVRAQVLKSERTSDKAGKAVDRVALSMKALQRDPWELAAETLTAGVRVSGKVTRLEPFGAFIALEAGVDGLAHVSELSDKRVNSPQDVLKVGQDVQAVVLSVDAPRHRIALSLRTSRPVPTATVQARLEGEAPSATKAERPKLRVGDVVTGTVDRVEGFGVILKLEGDVFITVPNSELGVQKNADQRVDMRKFFKNGDSLKVAITQVDNRGVRASKVEAEKAEERSLMREWANKQPVKGNQGFGILADALRRASTQRSG